MYLKAAEAAKISSANAKAEAIATQALQNNQVGGVCSTYFIAHILSTKIYIHTYICTSYIHSYKKTYISLCINTYIQILSYIHKSTNIYTLIVYKYLILAFKYICIHKYITDIYKYIYTYMHTYTSHSYINRKWL